MANAKPPGLHFCILAMVENTRNRSRTSYGKWIFNNENHHQIHSVYLNLIEKLKWLLTFYPLSSIYMSML